MASSPVQTLKRAYAAVLETKDAVLTQNAKVDEKLDSIQKSLKEIRTEQQGIIDLQVRLDELHGKVDTLSTEVLKLQKINDLYFEALFQHNGESRSDIMRRFFSGMPKASGDIRIYQDGNAKLLKELVSLCQKNNMQYWLQSGTLLGAVRHDGFIPWDDDTDIAMFRDDIESLRQILKNNPKYQITLIYDWFCKSRQIRFCTKNPENPCFVDIYIYDYCDQAATPQVWQQWHHEKEKIITFFDKNQSAAVKAWREQKYISEDDKYASVLKELFLKHCPPPPTPKIKKSKSVIWGLDNFAVKWQRLFDWDFIFPTVQLTYEGSSYSAPREYNKYLKRQYGDIYQLPTDLISHYQHIDHNNINIDVIREFLDEK